MLFTDHLLSPLAADADVVLVTTLDTGSPFSMMSPALAAVETVLVTVVDRLGGAPTARMERYDELSTEVVPGRRPDRRLRRPRRPDQEDPMSDPRSDAMGGTARTVSLVDHHCHGVASGELDRAGLEALISEGGAPPDGETNFDTPVGLAIRRHCAPLLDLEPHAPVEEYLARRSELGTARGEPAATCGRPGRAATSSTPATGPTG